MLVRMSMKEIGIFDTKTHLSELIQKVMEGERFVITRRGEPVAELRPVTPERRPLKKGAAAHPDYRMSDDFDEELEDFADYR
jgi:prevent-host-death family protein